MGIDRIVIASTLALMVAACGGEPDRKKAEAPRPVERGMPLEQAAGRPNVNAEVMRMHRVAGRWQSEPGSVKGGGAQWIALDISNDRKLSLQVRGIAPDGKTEAVNAEARGEFTWSRDGILEARASGGKGPLATFPTFRGSFPEPGAMEIRSPGGETYKLTYRGL